MTPLFSEFYAAHLGYVTQSLRRLGIVDTEDLREETQQVFLHVARQLPHYDTTRPPRPWLFGFCHYAASNYHRLARNRVALDALPSNLPSPRARELERSDARHRLELALEHLSFTDRALLGMHVLGGFTAPEIARTMGIEPAQVYARIRTARRRLRHILDAFS